MIFGSVPDCSLVNVSDQQMLPIEYIMGPMNINWYIPVLTALFPGVGLLHRLNREYFCTQNMRKNPPIANNTMIG